MGHGKRGGPGSSLILRAGFNDSRSSTLYPINLRTLLVICRASCVMLYSCIATAMQLKARLADTTNPGAILLTFKKYRVLGGVSGA